MRVADPEQTLMVLEVLLLVSSKGGCRLWGVPTVLFTPGSAILIVSFLLSLVLFP